MLKEKLESIRRPPTGKSYGLLNSNLIVAQPLSFIYSWAKWTSLHYNWGAESETHPWRIQIQIQKYFIVHKNYKIITWKWKFVSVQTPTILACPPPTHTHPSSLNVSLPKWKKHQNHRSQCRRGVGGREGRGGLSLGQLISSHSHSHQTLGTTFFSSCQHGGCTKLFWLLSCSRQTLGTTSLTFDLVTT